ncbi:MAG TPA: tRNA pseudouridine(55) synthase TruB [Stellaceae bacterium]|jgi:tRNA pseudouridine55 synthase|nr:tRNA pseudouridine(55) synthase TruB [Stellaceae bacterium]
MRRRKGRPVHGWVVLDKPLGMSSAQAVATVRRLFDAAKAGHAGTLDPLATGVLPIALGEATKAMPYVVAGSKIYRFTLRWGVATDTDDAAGTATATSAARPSAGEIQAALPAFIGTIEQTPPAYSALKIAGARAYDLARQGAAPVMTPRPITVERLVLIEQADPDHATFEADVGKGTYIRALGRDLALALGTVAHVAALRRLAVGPFRLDGAISLENLAALAHSGEASEHLLSVETALDDIPALAVTEAEAASLRHGRPVTSANETRCRGLSEGTTIRAVSGDRLVAFAQIRDGGLQPIRVLNFD